MTALSRPLLRWAGSKRQIVPLLLQLAPREFSRYVEPFAGSAAFFFGLAPARALVADSNAELINFYRVIRRRPADLHAAASALPRREHAYVAMRRRDPASLSPFDRAVRFFYLNRLCFNGVYRVNQQGRFNVPMGAKIAPFPDSADFMRHARQLGRARLRCADFSKVLEECGPGDFIYADPPYYANRHRGEYGAQRFGSEELQRLVESLQAASNRGARIALSYSNEPALRKALHGWRARKITVLRSVAGSCRARGHGHELLLTNYTPG